MSDLLIHFKKPAKVKQDVNIGPGSVTEEHKNTKWREFLSVIADVIRQEVLTETKDWNRVILLLDASTDTLNEKEINFGMRYIYKKSENGRVISFLSSPPNLNSGRFPWYLRV
jgi:hypothetical protein